MSARREGLDAALEYAGRGWPVFPIVPRGKTPLTEHGHRDATTDPDQIRAWWRRWPAASIGTAVPDSLAVLDVDGQRGENTLAEFQAAYHPLPNTLRCRTGGGGRHLYLLHPGGELRQGTNILGAGLDTRMPRKGYAVLPPSTHPSGRRYQWVDPATPVAAMPSWLAALLRPLRSVRAAPQSVTVSDAYVRAAADGELRNVAGAPVGSRNTQLHKSAIKLGTLVGAGVLSESDATAVLLEGARACGYLDDDGERAARRTIESGLSWGMAHPRGLTR